MILKSRTTMIAVLLAMVAVLSACAAISGRGSSQKPAVTQQLQDLEQKLKLETWDKVQDFFSSGYYGGYEELRSRLENRWRDEDLVAIEFIVNKVLESDGQLNASVRWHMSYLDRQGKPGKRSGDSEILLKPAGDSYRILNIKGDSFF